MRHRPQLPHQLRVARAVNVVDRVSQIPLRIQHLPLDVDPLVRQDVVDRPQNAGHVVMDMHQPVRSRLVVQMAMRQIHAEQRIAARDIVHHARRHELPDILLRLFRASPDMRRQNHVRQTLQRT